MNKHAITLDDEVYMKLSLMAIEKHMTKKRLLESIIEDSYEEVKEGKEVVLRGFDVER